jgi:hypothetical protein
MKLKYNKETRYTILLVSKENLMHKQNRLSTELQCSLGGTKSSKVICAHTNIHLKTKNYFAIQEDSTMIENQQG